MNPEYLLPFKVGDLAESKSFERGYRGAWFRCEIKDMGDNKRGKLAYLLEFFDYAADKPRWTQLYQKLPYKPKSPQALIQLMVRPSYPTVYLESEAPHPSTISDVIVVVHGTWKVGDLVDWWYEGCYWSGIISQVYEDGNYEVHLLEPPIGEGKCYTADVTSLRPSLDWCPELGWTIPHSEGKGSHHASVRLVHPCDRGIQSVPKSSMKILSNNFMLF